MAGLTTPQATELVTKFTTEVGSAFNRLANASAGASMFKPVDAAKRQARAQKASDTLKELGTTASELNHEAAQQMRVSGPQAQEAPSGPTFGSSGPG